MKSIIHVNQQVIAWNRKHNLTLPPITVKQGGKTQYCNSVDITGASQLVSRPHKPLSCGARIWIETESPVVLEGVITWKKLKEKINEVVSNNATIDSGRLHDTFSEPNEPK